tara:strand:- start:384 stop:590 length:207 start_codon:yes stop_codon:yes gene_type:complete
MVYFPVIHNPLLGRARNGGFAGLTGCLGRFCRNSGRDIAGMGKEIYFYHLNQWLKNSGAWHASCIREA